MSIIQIPAIKQSTNVLYVRRFADIQQQQQQQQQQQTTKQIIFFDQTRREQPCITTVWTTSIWGFWPWILCHA